MVNRVITCFSVFLIVSLGSKVHSAEKSALQEAYYQAKENQRTQPRKTIELWHKHQSSLTGLPDRLRYNWRLFATIAYLVENEYSEAAKVLGQMITMPVANNPADMTEMANLAGVLFSRTMQHQIASSAYRCALKQNPDDPIINARLFNNLALSLDQEGDFSGSVGYYEQAIDIVEKQNNFGKLALYISNLGYSLLTNGQSDKSRPYLKRALFLKEKYSNDAHKVKTALYLLHALTDLRDWALYDRYFGSIEQMVKYSPVEAHRSYFGWLQTYARFSREGVKPTEQEKSRLVAMIKNEKELSAIHRHFQPIADILKIDLAFYAPLKKIMGTIDDNAVATFVTLCANDTGTSTAHSNQQQNAKSVGAVKQAEKKSALRS